MSIEIDDRCLGRVWLATRLETLREVALNLRLLLVTSPGPIGPGEVLELVERMVRDVVVDEEAAQACSHEGTSGAPTELGEPGG